jgi:2TM domain
VPSFRWHVRSFLLLNAALGIANLATGKPWWAFWPLLATGFLLALHFFAYKSFSVDDVWADERAQELNLKSYDRSHIEDLKSRYDK